MTRFGTAMLGVPAIGSTKESRSLQLPAAIASRWTGLQSALRRRLAQRRLRRSIAHLDDRLLADVGLGPQHLGFAERHARRGSGAVGRLEM
jgi:uncharacterized protein YjiS (DUF1127 family)